MAGSMALSTGLLSGIDSAALVDALTAKQKEPINQAERDKYKLQIQKEEYQSVNSALQSVEDSLLQLSLSATYNKKAASYSKEGIVTASPNTDAEEGVYDIEVTKLAQAHKIASKRYTSTSSALSSSDNTISINGISIEVDAGASMNDLKSALNGMQEQTGVKAAIINNTLILESTTTGADSEIKLEDVSGTLFEEMELTSGIIEISGDNAPGKLFRSVEAPVFRAEAGTMRVNGTDVILGGGENLSELADAINFAVGGTTYAFVRDNQLNIANSAGTNTLEDVSGNNVALLSAPVLKTSEVFTETTTTGSLQSSSSTTTSLWANKYGGFTTALKNYLVFDDQMHGIGETFQVDDTIEINGNRYKVREAINAGTTIGTFGYIKNFNGTDLTTNQSATLDSALPYTVTRSYLDLNGKTLTINGTDINFSTDHNISEVAELINSSGTDVIASISDDNRLQLMSGSAIALSGTASPLLGTFSTSLGTVEEDASYLNDEDVTINVNGTDINIQAYSTLKDVAEVINTSIGEELVRVVDGGLDTNGAISLTDVNGNFIQELNLDTNAPLHVLQSAQNAEFSINGLDITKSTNEITDAIENVTFTLEDVGSTTVEIKYDTENTRTKIEDFLGKYNQAIELIYNKLNAKRDFKIKGLTPDEMAEMSEDKLNEHEESMREIALAGDPTLSRAYQILRSIAYTQVQTDGKFSSLSQIGITSGAVGSNKDQTKIGTLAITDTSKFESALGSNIADILKLFSQDSTDQNNTSALGIARRIKDSIHQFTKFDGFITKKAGRADGFSASTIDVQIAQLQADILFKTKNLQTYQETLLTQFTNMETSLAKLQEQSNALQQAGGV